MRSGNLNYSIPLLAAKMRGGKGVTIGLSYNSQNWRRLGAQEWRVGTDTGYGFGWRVMAGAVSPVWLSSSQLLYYVFADSTGSEYKLDQLNNGVWTSKEGVYVSYDTNYAPPRLYFNDGTYWEMDCLTGPGEDDAGTRYPTKIQDSNGNQAFIRYAWGLDAGWSQSSSRIQEIEDVRAPSAGGATYAFGYTQNFEPHARLTSIANTVGTNETYAFEYDPAITTSPGTVQSPFTGVVDPRAARRLRKVTVTSVSHTYDIEYGLNNSGEVTAITEPFGARLEWDHVTGTYAAAYQIREVAARRLRHKIGAGLWSYPITHDQPGDTGRVVRAWTEVEDASAGAGKARHRFEFDTGVGSNTVAMLTKKETKDATNVVRSRETVAWNVNAVTNPYVRSVVSATDPGIAGQELTKRTEQILDQFGNVLQVIEFDQGTSTWGLEIRRMDYDYLTSPAYINAYMRNRLTQARKTENGVLDIMVTNTYDNYGASMVNRTGLRQHDTANYGTGMTLRGNVTLSAGIASGAFVTYDITGQPTQTTANGQTATVQSNGSTNFAAPSQITVSGPGNNHTTNLNWNSFLGLTSASGANGETASVVYEPGKSRPQSTTSKTGAITTYAYGAPNPAASVAGTMTATTGTQWVKTTYGGFGRPVLVETGTGGTTVSVSETEYMPCSCTPVGKTWRSSRPHAPGAASDWTTNEYDALGRTVKVIAPDGSQTTYAYAANRVRTTDAKGKWKEFTMNVLGQLATVTEPNPQGGADYSTTYHYNTLGQLKLVTMPRPTGTQVRTFNYNSVGKLTWADNPETARVDHEYYPWTDPADTNYGLLKHTIDAKKQKTEYLYDAYQRVTEVKRYPKDPFANAPSATPDACQGSKNYYDTNPFDGAFGTYLTNRLAAKEYYVCEGGVTRTVREMYSYSQAGLLLQKRLQVQRLNPANGQMGTQNLDGVYTWNNMSQMLTMRYPSSDRVYEYAVDGMYRYTEMTERVDSNPNFPATLVSGLVYGAAGELKAASYHAGGTTTSETREYNALGQLTLIQAMQGSYTAAKLEYLYTAGSNNGRISGMTNHATGESITYQYDSLNRLVQQASNLEATLVMGYDGFGNLTQNGGQSIGVDAANRLTGFSYDANGNQTTRMVGSTMQTLSYDIANRLLEQTGTAERYGYAPDNRRVFVKTASGQENWVFWGPNGKQLAAYYVEFDQSTQQPFLQTAWVKKWFGTKEVSSLSAKVHDRLGSTVAVGGTRQGYYPYGEPRTQGGASGGSEFATYTTDSTGLMYADQRYYQSGVGRFATADPYVASGGAADPGSWNRFSYTRGDPVNAWDPSGLQDCPPGHICAPMPPFPQGGGGGSSPHGPAPTDPPEGREPYMPVQGAGTALFEQLKGAKLATDKLDKERCWKAMGATSSRAAKEVLLGTKIVLTSDGFDAPTSRPGADPDTRYYEYSPARTAGGVIYVNTLGNTPLMNPTSVSFTTETGATKTLSILPFEADNLGLTEVSAETFQALVWLHELGHIMRGLEDDTGDTALSQKNTRKVYDECFK